MPLPTPLPPALREKILDSPALAPPPGVIPNFTNPSNLEIETYGMVAAFMVLGTTSVGVRLWTKWRVVGRVKWWGEDGMLFISWLIYTGMLMPLAIISAKIGAGTHQWNLTVRQAVEQGYYYNIGSLAYILSMLFLKTAILLQCIRVLVPTGTRNAAFYLYHALLAANIIFYIVSAFIELFSCSPRAKLWDPTIVEGKCVGDITAKRVVSGVINMLTDFVVLVLAQKVVWGLGGGVGGKRRGRLSGVFFVGALPCICSIVEIYYHHRGAIHGDKTHWVSLIAPWGFAELAFGHFAASVVVMPRFFKYLFDKPFFVRLSESLSSRRKDSSEGDDKRWSRVGRVRIESPKRAEVRRPVVTDVEYEELVVNGGMSEREWGGGVEDGVTRPEPVFITVADAMRTV
ncbi:hypothetical protein BDV95DRAFT_210963 [Massariosphaeria phaeospora]|uniref:Rhodopsin domain-containing protein n=1 Tax=Massariosphaeria phaeospora TaxID=100035 RepID=A0A7C8M2I1_9PLEO|nr:hypothetical protein BDV95DRAFT_210963 [Massariosphaeria phaeospora]